MNLILNGHADDESPDVNRGVEIADLVTLEIELLFEVFHLIGVRVTLGGILGFEFSLRSV